MWNSLALPWGWLMLDGGASLCHTPRVLVHRGAVLPSVARERQLVFMKWSFFGVLPQQVTSHDLLGTSDGSEKLSINRSFCCSKFFPSGFGVVGSRFRRCSRDVRSRAHIWSSQPCRTPISCSEAFLCCPVDAVTVSRGRSHFNLQPISLCMNAESWWY